MARLHSSATHLDLGAEGMTNLTRQINELYSLYRQEFLDAPQQAQSHPSTEIDINASVGAYTSAHVRASSRIESQDEYQAKLSAHQQACKDTQEASIKDHINMKVVLIVSDLDANKIMRNMDRVPFMKESGRKLFVYDCLSQDPLG